MADFSMWTALESAMQDTGERRSIDRATVRRVATFARPHARTIGGYLALATMLAVIGVAIPVLAGHGLVTAVPNRGVFVRQLSLREMSEVYEMRALVFGHAAARACEHLSDEHKRQFERLLAAMDEACEANDGTRYYEVNLQFHALILSVANNRRAQQAYDDYVKELHLFRRRYFDRLGNRRRSNIEHRAIYEAMVASDPARARAAAEQHVLGGRTRLLSSLDEPLAPGDSGR